VKLDLVSLLVFLGFFALVTVLGFYAGQWRRGDLAQLDEWGLGGRRFGTWISWFLIGGDLYTAYTLIAVPALVFAVGAYGFFALPYTILVYPIMFVMMPRLWNVSKARLRDGRLTSCAAATARPAGARDRADGDPRDDALHRAAARRHGGGHRGAGRHRRPRRDCRWHRVRHPRAYTYTSGLRAPAMIAFVKDLMIYIVVLVAIIMVPTKLGGFGPCSRAATAHFAKKVPPVGATILGPAYWSYATLALGSAMALFMYPHALTGSSRGAPSTSSSATPHCCRRTRCCSA
jgi:SSS family solute:Na+ symporter